MADEFVLQSLAHNHVSDKEIYWVENPALTRFTNDLSLAHRFTEKQSVEIVRNHNKSDRLVFNMWRYEYVEDLFLKSNDDHRNKFLMVQKEITDIVQNVQKIVDDYANARPHITTATLLMAVEVINKEFPDSKRKGQSMLNDILKMIKIETHQ